MAAVLSVPFFAVLQGNVYPETIPAGTTLEGELAEIAGNLGLLVGAAPATDFASAVQITIDTNQEIQATIQEMAKRSRKAAARSPEVKG